jgi:hypothetical protein
MVKVFISNEKGKIEFTKEELESLLNEVWDDGYRHQSLYKWQSPITTNTKTIPTIPYSLSDGDIKITCGEEKRWD